MAMQLKTHLKTINKWESWPSVNEQQAIDDYKDNSNL